MPTTARTAIAVVGIDIGKNSFDVVGLDDRGAIVLRQKWSHRGDNPGTDDQMDRKRFRL